MDHAQKKNSVREEYLKNGDLKMQSTPAGVGQFAVYFVYELHMEARVYWLHVYGNNVLAYVRDGCQAMNSLAVGPSIQLNRKG